MFPAFARPLLGMPLVRFAWLRPMSIASVICASLLYAGGSHATSPAALDEIQQLMAKGQFSAASKRVQTYLKQDKDDVQLRFLQAVIAAEQKNYDHAIRLFTALTQDHPTLPEPYNNLAVIYAFRGDDRKATEVLEQAIRTNPSYATAHQNLGDLYARIASDAYAKALQLDSAKQAEKPKLELIARIATPLAASSPTTTASASTPSFSSEPPVSVATASAPPPLSAPTLAPAAVVLPPSEPPKVPVTSPEPATPAPAVKTIAPSQEEKPVAPTPAAPTPAAPTPAAPTPAAPTPAAPTPAAPTPVAQHAQPQAVTAIEKAVAAWASAWEQQNMNAYYAAYSSRFAPNGMSLSAWKKERKERIVGKPTITVKISDLKITVNGERASASFRQHYASGGYKASTRKTLQMAYEGAKWRITREEAGR